MQAADFNHEDFTTQGTSAADKTLLVKFYVRPKQNQAASKKEGRPIFKDVEYIDIKVPGTRSGGACRPATQGDKQRFPEHYTAFKNRIEGAEEMVGTPLSEWPQISRSRIEEMAFFHIKTVEQLANMADAQVSQFMGGYDLKRKAAEWLEQVEDEKPFIALENQIGELREQNKQLQESVAALMEQNKGLAAKAEAKAPTVAIEPSPLDGYDAEQEAVEQDAEPEPETKAKTKAPSRRRKRG